jgi:enoyl-CoA hydratase/carnithine racemase
MSTLRLERDGAIAVLWLDKPRGNAIDEALLDDLAAACRELAGDESRVMLLASANAKLFCPGLDLVTLVGYDRPRLQSFMLKFAETMWALYGLRKPVVAAVNGHAVAGGCILALTADYRILKRGAQIGLNEVKVGVPLPWSVSVLLRATTTPTALSRIALLGRNFADEQALAVGLADELADAEGFDAACRSRLDEFVEKDAGAIATTKGYLRDAALQEMKAREGELVDDFLAGWFSTATQARIKQAVESLSRKSAV